MILIDDALPGARVDELCARIRGRDRLQDLPIIAAVGHESEDVSRLFAAGVSDVLRRPLHPEVVRRRLMLWQSILDGERRDRRSRRLLTTLQRVARIATWELEIETRRFIGSEEVRPIFALAPEMPITLPSLLARVSDDESQVLRNLVHMSIETGEGFSVETKLQLPGGAAVVAWQAEAVLDGAGKIVRVIGSVQDITERAEAEEQVRYLAYHDGLTGLTNRHGFMERLRDAVESARRHRRSLALLFLDLDNFKRINDTLGHSVGDRLLQHVARRLEACVRSDDVIGSRRGANSRVSRLGGDEFTVLLNEVRSAEDAARVARRILEALREPIRVGRNELVAGVSIGITVFPSDGDDVDALLRNADVAMYDAKSSGRNTYRFFSRDLSDAESRRLTMESRLSRAFESGGLELYYQPQTEVETGRITGVEALLRWNDEVLGAVSPAEFVPVAEGAGLILPIGEWVIETACKQAAEWRAAGFPELKIGVNISHKQFESEQLLEIVGQTLFDTGIDPEHLVLEITESLFSKDPERVVALLRELKGIGVQVALDDFGTGYSSLSYLKRFPVDIVKIDRSFVRDIVLDPDDAAITEAIISMAQALRLRLIAEGVETENQRRFLASRGCPEMQGYLCSPPLSAEACTELLRSGPILKPAD